MDDHVVTLRIREPVMRHHPLWPTAVGEQQPADAPAQRDIGQHTAGQNRVEHGQPPAERRTVTRSMAVS